MTSFLPKDILDGLDAARRLARSRRSRMRVRMGERTYPVLRFWDGGLALAAEDAPKLRGLVDVYDGARHLAQCLIVASGQEGDEMVYEFKRATMAAERPPVDFARSDEAPAGLLPRL